MESQSDFTQLSQEEFEKKLKETADLCKKLREELKTGETDEWQIRDNLDMAYETLQGLELEKVRREEKLSEKVICELEEIAHAAHRRVRQMENYEWDVVQDSSEENQRGFWSAIHELELLEAAANLEIEKKFLASQTNSG